MFAPFVLSALYAKQDRLSRLACQARNEKKSFDFHPAAMVEGRLKGE
jgi:hypothetical protein